MRLIKTISNLLLFFLVCSFLASAQNLKPEEIIAKHIDSLGNKESRNSVKNRLAVGASEFIVKTPYGKLEGKAVLASDISNLFLLSSFDSPEYPLERIGYFKNKVDIPFIVSGKRSPLGGFLFINNKILGEKLFFGTISSSWVVLDERFGKAKIENGGKKEIDGQETYVLNYSPKNMDFSVKLYFDTKTFQHLRTEYRQTIHTGSHPIGTFGNANEMGIGNTLIEDFRDYKDINGLKLPHSYKVTLILDGRSGTAEYEWNIAIGQYHFNQKLDDSFFSFDKQ